MEFETFLKDLCLIELSDLVYTEPDAAAPLEYPSPELRLKLLPTINSALRQFLEARSAWRCPRIVRRLRSAGVVLSLRRLMPNGKQGSNGDSPSVRTL